MATVEELLGDVVAAIDRLRGAGDKDEQRQSLREALNCLYTLRSHFVETKGAAYYQDAQTSPYGRVAEGLSLLRGNMVHHLTAELGPKVKPLYPSEGLVPSADLHAGSNLSWLTGDEAKTAFSGMIDKTGRFAHYDAAVGGLPVLQSLSQAKDFYEGLTAAPHATGSP